MNWRQATMLALFSFLLFGCSYSKVCRQDGICEITENGKTRYEGDPAKIAALQKAKADAAKADREMLARINSAPRRGPNDPVRVALVPARGTGELHELEGNYDGMIRAELAGSGIELVDVGTVRQALDVAAGNVDPNSPFKSNMGRGTMPQKTLEWNADTVARLRQAGLSADVVVFTWLKPHEKTGLVGGRGQGAGIAQIVLVEFSGRLSSIWKFREYQARELGKSSNSLAAAGFGKDGKYGAGELKFKRNPDNDRASVKAFAGTLRQRILKEIRPQLPSLAALNAILKERAPAATAETPKVKVDLRKLFR